MDYFYVEESPKDCFAILINYRNTPIKSIERGTAFKIAALLYNLSYPNYLRMARDVYGGMVAGVQCLYPLLYFNNKEQAEALTKDLNNRMASIMPEWEEKFNGNETYSRSDRYAE